MRIQDLKNDSHKWIFLDNLAYLYINKAHQIIVSNKSLFIIDTRNGRVYHHDFAALNQQGLETLLMGCALAGYEGQ